MRWNFAHILNKSLIRPISYENSLWSLSKTKVFEAQTFVQLGCEFIQNMAKFQCIAFGCLFIFYHIPEVYRVDNYKIGNSSGCVWRTTLIVKYGIFKQKVMVLCFINISINRCCLSPFIFSYRMQNLSTSIV